MATKSKSPISAKRSYKDGYVSVSIALRASHFGCSLRTEGSTDLTTEQARALAGDLIAEADRSDAKVAARTVREENRKK